MFSRASPASASSTRTTNEDAHLDVTVTPSASAFYAGEVFSAVITFRNNRVPYHSRPITPHAYSVPTTPDPSTGAFLPDAYSTPGTATSSVHTFHTAPSPDRTYSPASAAWRGEHARRPSGKGHTRRTQSLALGKGTLSPQEMVWALGADSESLPVTPTPPPLPFRRGVGAGIPAAHPHARKISIASTSAFANSPPPSAGLPQSAPLPGRNDSDSQMQDAQATTPRTPDFSFESRTSLDAPGPSRRSTSGFASPSPSPTLPDVMEEPYRPSRHDNTTPEPPHSARSAPKLSPGLHSSTSSALHSSTSSFTSSASSIDSPSRDNGRRLPHQRAPSYHNAYGASLLSPPPVHPSMKNRLPLDTGSTTILWAHARLVARFSPSNQYIPPDPLLPLKSKLLHQPIGSGSLSPADAVGRGGSRWAINFGTGAIGKEAQPSLTGSLFGLAKGLVYGGSGGSLEEERKRVWNTSDLPVLETTRSLIGVDIRLAEGETREFVYTLQLPTSLPPAFKGRALRFSYELLLSLNVALPGPGKRQRTKEIIIPVRVWPNVSVANPLPTYDVLHPVIQNTEQASVVERPVQAATVSTGRRPAEPPRVKVDSLATYASRLLETLDADINSPMRVPPSPSKAMVPLSPLVTPSPLSPRLSSSSARSGNPPPFSPSSPVSPPRSGNPPLFSPASPVSPPRISPSVSHNSTVVSLNSPVNGGFPRSSSMSPHSPLGSTPLASQFLSAQGQSEKVQPLLRPRATSLIAGDDELVESAQRCGEAVEILSRHSPKSSFDIWKDGELVAVLTLIKTTYRLGETVIGVVTFNDPSSDRRLLKLSAFLETHEVIPEPLLPPSASSSGRVKQPELRKVHAEHRSAYAMHTARIAFSLDIPSDATPAFSLMAGDGKAGGLEWRVRLSFLVAVPPGRRKSMDARRSLARSRSRTPPPRTSTATHLLPTDGDADNTPYTAAPALVPFMRDGHGDYVETGAETVECEVPVSVLAGNTAFVVRPNMYSV